MTKAEFKKQLDALCKEMMASNTGFPTVEKACEAVDKEYETHDYPDFETFEEEVAYEEGVTKAYEDKTDKIVELGEWVYETLENYVSI
jgi:hypothetical protein